MYIYIYIGIERGRMRTRNWYRNEKTEGQFHHVGCICVADTHSIEA